ncbi:hypothetical protein WH47_06588 [Habropoda laboriosa]|uniref:CCHC-type domain-containing protein n=1 Tax=Habropoda laboriosa TaxID=597456 RepID=A0A0L7QSH5_9HYME|nr:hypothetical protein WH47_06588 [Habropoda laboriosa]
MTPRKDIEILDIDAAAIKKRYWKQLSSLARGRSGRPTSQSVADGPLEAHARGALTLVNRGKINVGYVACRAKLAPNLVRCFRCHDFGHIVSSCKKIEGEEMVCRKCGGRGHMFRSCSVSPKCRLCKEKGDRVLDHVYTRAAWEKKNDARQEKGVF